MGYCFFPNPSKGIFNVNVSIPGSFYTIYDISGRLVQQGRFMSESQEIINIRSFDDGMYMLKVVSATSMQTIKLIKQ
ncbi:MAG: T9SS type A sorting domain-containing protein [Flavobacteriales bacterium]